MRGRGKERGVVRAAEQPFENEKPRNAGMGPVMGCGKGERDIARLRRNQSREDG